DAHAPNSDSITHEWDAFPWLTITTSHGLSVHPDLRWSLAEGFAIGQRAYVMKGPPNPSRIRDIIAHEAGHESANQFKRRPFGPGDHTPGPGLMDTTGSQSTFAAGEKSILRGL